MTKKRTSKKKASKKKGRKSIGKFVDDEIIEITIGLLSRRKRKSEIRKHLNRLHPRGNVNVAMLERIITKARARIQLRLDRTHTETKSEAITLYEEMIRSPRTSMREKMIAQERIDYLLGHDARFTGSGTMSAEEIAAAVCAASQAMKKLVPKKKK
jgi:hypothetical protein